MQTFVNPFPDSLQPRLDAIGLLLLRLSLGFFMIYGHGWGKMTGFSELSLEFPDPLGIGSTASLTLALFAEFFCALAVAFGFFTRLASVPVVITMLVAVTIVHADDPFRNKELGLLYLFGYLTLFFKGAGAYSLDAFLRVRRPRLPEDARQPSA